MPYFLPVLLSLLFVATAGTAWVWAMPLLIMLAGYLHPAIGRFEGRELVDAFQFFHHNPVVQAFKSLNGVFFVGMNVWALWFLASHELAWWAYPIYLYGMIVINSNFGMSLAHELMHSDKRYDVLLANILMLQNGFFYLHTDHLYIHHRHVGTVADPASAQLHEPIYRYLLRSFFPRMRIVLGLSKTSELDAATIRVNRLKALACAAYAALAFYLHWQAGVWVLVQYVAVITIYESITYIQHYGLRRNRIDEAKYEHVALRHSWNCYYKLSNYLHFFMPVHSMHHVLQPDFDSALQDPGPSMPLPFGQMMMTAFRPRKWFALMNARMQKLQDAA